MLFVLCVFRGRFKTHTKHFLTKSGNTFRSQKLGAKHTLAHLAKWASRESTKRLVAPPTHQRATRRLDPACRAWSASRSTSSGSRSMSALW